MLDEQPVETTLYSLGESAPPPPERRTGERHLSLLRVGALTIDGRRELCLIRNISDGGMLIRAYCEIPSGTPLSIELKQGEPIAGVAKWTKDECVGVTFDRPIDILSFLSSSEDGPKPRMPRVGIDCTAWLRVDGDMYRARASDISQGGIKVQLQTKLPPGADVVVSVAGLDPSAGMIRWAEDGTYGITFNRVIPIAELVSWLQEQRGRMRAAG
jgi:hypothetical protein